jgi:Ni/Fe-hydrogenase subunit HybB-like protein
LKQILWAIVGLAFAVAISRFFFGLGATTNLTDGTPWGLWIGFDVMSGVALAAGGFVITGTVYIFRLEQFRPIVRPAVLTAFLGYVAVVLGLMFDLGLPWNIWHALVHWNTSSVLFEVAWCVMLYTSVLALEFLPVPLEATGAFANLRRILKKIRLPLVVVGIALSTLHQSSLGSLFLIMPYKVHPLWYSPIMPVLFFISAIGLGFLMITFESRFTSNIYGRQPETTILARFLKAGPWIFGIYLFLRLGDLVARGNLHFAFEYEWRSLLFWIEIALSGVIPIFVLSIPAWRAHPNGQWFAALSGIFGIVLNRINVGGASHMSPDGVTFYLPAWTEIAVSAGVVAGAALVFMVAVERFNIYEKAGRPEFDSSRLRANTIERGLHSRRRWVYSLIFVLFAGLGFALQSAEGMRNKGIDPAPVKRARGGEELFLDGNRDGYGAQFPHQMHMELLEDRGCGACHHMNLPGDEQSGCYQCHRDMYVPTDAFGHDWHASPSGATLACYDCHSLDGDKSKQTAKNCKSCHNDLIPDRPFTVVKQYMALSYTEAMHRRCIGCHITMAEEFEDDNLPRCQACHTGRRPIINHPPHPHDLRSKRVVTPPVLLVVPGVEGDASPKDEGEAQVADPKEPNTDGAPEGQDAQDE